jgi:deazaflavin-dependent oxidoreductase (nitroreductase family)
VLRSRLRSVAAAARDTIRKRSLVLGSGLERCASQRDDEPADCSIDLRFGEEIGTMKGTQLAVRFALTPLGAAIDRFCVRRFGHSPVVWLFTRSDGAAYNRPLVLTTVGRKSGKQRAVVLPYFDTDDGRIAIVGSRGGMPTDPHWAGNLRACPEARVHVNRREHDVRAHLAEGDERARLWGGIVERSPIYARYQKRAAAHREIPLFVLERKDGCPLSGRAVVPSDMNCG